MQNQLIVLSLNIGGESVYRNKIYQYLKKVSGCDEISDDDYIISDLRLSSKEIIDFAIFVFKFSNVKLSLKKDIRIKDILSYIQTRKG